MNLYDIEALKNRINFIENELDVLKHWINLLVEESNKVKIVTVPSKSNIDSGSTTRYYDDTVTHTCDDPVVIITE